MVFINQPLSATMPAISADAMLAKGDLEGQAVWKRIARAVGEIQRREPAEGEPRH